MRHQRTGTHENVAQTTASVLARLRVRGPRVHCITNTVAQNFTANILLAAGAIPSMTVSPEEIGDFVARADALLINLGTFDRERREAVDRALESASGNGVPWVLDPVLIDRSPLRADFARELLGQAPKAVRLNRAEFAALAEREAAGKVVAEFAHEKEAVIGLSGETDLVTDGERVAMIANGDPLMAKVTAMGCAASALIAACMSVEPDGWRATAAGLAMIGVAGELAAAKARGSGSFAVAMIDALYGLDEATLLKHVKVDG